METTIAYWGLYWEMEKKMETTIVYWGLYWDKAKKMETTLQHPCATSQLSEFATVSCSVPGSGGACEIYSWDLQFRV